MPEDTPFFPLISADGTRIDGLDMGAGHPLIVLHGGMSAAANWRPVAELLPNYRVLAIDRRVYNRTVTPNSPHSMAREADDVLAVLDKLGRKALLAGHSSGAVAALEAALRADHALAGLALYEPPVQTDTILGEGAQQDEEAALAAGDPETALTIFFERMVELPADQLERMKAQPWFAEAMLPQVPNQLADNRAIIGLGLGVERYRALKMPTLMLRGETSPAHLHRRLAALAAVIPDTELVEFPGEGHNAAPQNIAAALEAFADRLVFA